jgi:nucleotide-binding universal stress UspA family protein
MVTDPTGELRVVVGIDGSRLATRALRFAAHEAALRGALLHIVSAYEVAPATGSIVAPLGPFQESATIVSEALNWVRELEPSVVTKGDHRHGSAGLVLVEASRGATLLVVGSRGRGEVASLLLGSVSEHCVHHACCPVTVVY